MTTSDFARLGVPTALVDALAPQGITSPTPIQAATLPDSLAGRDVLGRGRTGSGKTYAFLLPLVARLLAEPRRRQARRPRSLVLAPTRELASQIADSLAPLERAGKLRSTVVFGGVGQNPQVNALAGGVDVLIACPGRLLDLMGQGHADLSAIEITVIDEADHMADMGFLPMVRRILAATPAKGQRMLFSATLDAGVDKIVQQFLHDPVTHSADPATSPVGTMEHHVLEVDPTARFDVLRDLAAAPGRTIMFTRTKYGAKNLARKLAARGVDAVDLHGNLSQNARTRNLEAFGSGTATTMVCTDIAARGIHVDEVALVVHADPPIEHKAYLHRSGRTARAGESGTVITVQTPEQRKDVHDLMRKAGITPTRHQGVTAASPVLSALAPGQRVETHEPRGPVTEDSPEEQARREAGIPGGGRGRGRGQGGGQGHGGRGGRGGQGGGEGRGRGGQGARGGENSGQQGQGQGRGRGESGGQGGRGGQGSRGGQGRGRSGGQGRSGSGSVYSTSTGGSSSGGGLAAFSSRRGR
ncbi:DEAD/DEAH box helicase [Brachybacterium sp. J144]|uniref:DEAD/DEAH box helicase n=1 Tax=Brachybacterium sp. J144 TaxID=3116487 RepID=UPI002E76925E|nr:DEAD/DEAH box helicase [Brachybacterium sp. J144]MEE1651586.1 DEAD/DEAH box helicase [Brachybacterium sp. J144]